MTLPAACPSMAHPASGWYLIGRCWLCQQAAGFNGISEVVIADEVLGLCDECTADLKAAPRGR